MSISDIEERLIKRARAQAKSSDEARHRDLWSKGFLPDKWGLYQLDRNDASLYLSDIQREATNLINAPYSAILNNKITFDLVYRGRVPVAEVVGFCGPARFVMPGAECSTFFAKSVSGGGGAGVNRCHWDGATVTWRGMSLTPTEFCEKLRERNRPYVFSKAVDQHPSLKELHPKTTNTLRLLMMKDGATSTHFIAASVLRVGVARSGDVDNFSSGGVSVGIDPATGVTFGAKLKGGQSLERHPESDQKLVGFQVPNWQDVVELAHRACRVCPEIEYVGWDIIPTVDGAVLLEGNSYSDVNLLQVHRPLLADPRVRAFYERHGILDIRTSMPLQPDLVSA